MFEVIAWRMRRRSDTSGMGTCVARDSYVIDESAGTRAGILKR